MASIALKQEDSLTLPSAGELAVKYKLEPVYALLAEVPKDFLPDLCGMYGFLEHLLLSAQRCVIQFPCSLKTLETFLNSAEYHMLRDQFGNKEVATDEDAEKVIKTIISSHSLQRNISPQILAEVFMEIIRETKTVKGGSPFHPIVNTKQTHLCPVIEGV
jgi:hypothetical protein